MSITVEGAMASLLQARPAWAGNMILTGLRGSDAHGTKLGSDHARDIDDIDTFAICVQPEEWYLGLGDLRWVPATRDVWETSGSAYDHLVYDVRKAFWLLAKGNPNVHSWLWNQNEDYFWTMEAGETLLEHRDVFMSHRVLTSLGGYAQTQFEKMERTKYAGYQGEKRRAMVDEFGYDVKHAAHCLRLLWMGIELAETGRLTVRRDDDEVEILKAVKAGRWSFDKVRSWADGLTKDFELSCKMSDLPDEPDMDDISGLLVRVIREANN